VRLQNCQLTELNIAMGSWIKWKSNQSVPHSFSQVMAAES